MTAADAAREAALESSVARARQTVQRVGARFRRDGALAFFLATVPLVAFGQSIVVDGRTATTLSTQGSVTDVTTATRVGGNAFNSFSRFGVDAGSTVNLHVPTAANNLVNIVRDQRTDIFGVLNGVKDGRIGGNVWFANPHGFMVGASGVVNVGSLMLTTPTQAFVDNFFLEAGLPDATATAQLLGGVAPRNPGAPVTIQGRVNASGEIGLLAGTISVGGTLFSGARFVGAAPDFSDVVNANGVVSGSNVVLREGRITLVADGDIAVSGTLAAPGGAGVRGGDITVRAGNDLDIDAGARIVARGNGAGSAGGTVYLWGEHDATFRSGALVDAGAGSTGDGGSIELSARNHIDLAGGEFRAAAPGGQRGKVLIDPATVTVSSNFYSGGADHTIQADDSITVNAGVVISTRNVAGGAGADQEVAASIGDSGDLMLEAPSILLANGSKLLAHADSGHAGGDVTLKAHQNATTSIMGYREATASIQVGDAGGGATIRGRNIEAVATTDVDTKWTYDGDNAVDNTINVATTASEAIGGFLLGLVGINFVHSQAIGTAIVTVKAGSTLAASDSVTLRAENNTTAGVAPDTGINGPGTVVNTPLGLGALFARNNALAKVEIEAGATVKAQDLAVRAHNNATLEASIASGDPGDDASSAIGLAVGYADTDIKAQALVRAGANLKVTGDVSIAATNANSFGNTVESMVGNNGKAAAAIAISDFKTAATAELGAGVKDAAKVEVIAINDTAQNVTSANAKVGETLNDMIRDGIEQKLGPIMDPTGTAENFFWDKLLGGQEPDTKVKPKSTPFRIGGGIAYATSTADATALVGPGAAIHASDSVVVGARNKAADIQIVAESAAVSQSRERAAADTARNTFSAGVAIGSYEHDALAKVGSGASVTAPKVAVTSDVIIPVRESLLTGGSFDRWDGLSTVKDWFDSITNIFDVFNGASAAKSTSDNSNGSISLSGSVSVLSFKNTARSVLDTNAKLNLTGAATGSWSHDFEVVAADATASPEVEQLLHEWTFSAPAHVRASREATLLFHGGHFLPGNSGGGNAGGKGLGLAYTQETLTGSSEAIVREGAAIQGVDETLAGTDADGLRSWTQAARATGEAQVTAEGKDLLISIAASGGYGSSFGLNGSASIVTVNNNSRALVDDEAVIKAEKFSVLATDTPVAWSLAGGFNKSSSSGVGVGIAYNGVTGNTHAEIADNDSYQGERATARASEAAAAGSVASRDLAVVARTGGRAEAIAVTGAVSWSSPDNNTSSGGFFSSIQSKYQGIQDKLAHLVDLKPQSVSKSGGSSQGGTSAKSPSSFGLSGAGSATVNDVDFTTIARVDGATIDQDVGTLPASLVVRGINDTDIVTASGAAALTRANNSSQTGSAAITGSVAVNLIDSDTRALLDNSTVTDSHDVTVQALAGGEQLSIAIGASIDASNQQSKNNSFAITGSLSLSLVDNEATARADNSDITGEAAASGRDVDVTAYNRTFIGTGGGTLSVGGKTGAGGSVTYSDVTNDVSASIAGGSTLAQVDKVGVKAYNATEIGAGAAHGQASNATNGNAIGGAVVITEITNNTTAAIAGGASVTATGAVDVLAKDQGADNALELLIDPGNQRANVVKGLDYCGRDAGGVGATPGGNCITSVAGVVQLGRGNNIGLSFNWSDIHNNLTASVDNASVTSTGAGGIAVKAESSTTITSFAVGVGASDKVSGAGSVAVNRIDNAITAGVTGGSTLSGDTLSIGAKDTSRIDTLGGQINVGKSAAVGAAVTYAEIGNEALAYADNATLQARSATTLSAENDSRIRSLAVAGTLALGSSAPAVSASISVNFIDNRTEATADGATFDDPAGGANTHGVTVKADDKAEIQSLAGSVAVGTSAGVGGAFAYNKIGNTVTASIEDSALHRAALIDVSALESAKITSLSVAVAGGQTAAVSGSISLNHIGNPDAEDGNVVTAEIKDSTADGAASAASVKASDTSTIESLAGAVSVSLGSAAAGGAVADNATHNTAKASVAGSSLQGFGSLLVEGSNSSTIKSLSAAGAGSADGAFAGSASSNRTANTTLSEISGSDLTGGTADVTVNALDSAIIQSLAGSVAVGISAAGVGASVAVNRIANVNEARVTGKLTATGLDVLNLGVKADSLATIDTVAVAGGVGGAVGVAGSAAVNIIDNTTEAHISDGAVVESDRNATVVAESDDRITVGAGSVGVGISAAGIGASVVVNQIGGATRAHISGAGTVVSARNLAGTPTVAVASGALTTPVDLLDGTDSATYVRPDLVALRATESVSGVAVNAAATHHVESYVANVGAGTVGISGVANVNIIGGETKAYIDGATINRNDGGQNAAAGAAQDVHVKASDHAYGNMFIGSVAGGVVGVGVTADVAVFDRDTKAYMQDATVTAKDKAVVGAQSGQGMSTVVVGGAGGLVGVVGAGSVIKFTSETDAWLADSTATVGSLDVKARHDSHMFIVGGAVSVGAVGVGATFDVALDNSVTRAHIDDSTVVTAGQVNVDAQSATEIHAWTVAGAAAGAVAAAGTASVAIVGNTTQAWVSGSAIGSAGARAAGLAITAKDVVTLEQNAGAGAGAGVAGAGVAAAVTKVQNTTSAYMDDATAHVANDIAVDAQSERDLSTVVATAGGGLFAGIGGSVGVTLVGTALANNQSGDTNANKELNKDGAGTLSEVNGFSNGNAIGSQNLASSSDNGYAGAGLTSGEMDAINNQAKLDTSAQVYSAAAQSAVAETFDPVTQLAGKTAAVIGGSSVASANRDVRVHASEKDRIRLYTGAVAGGLAGIGGSVSVAQVTNNVEAAILGTTQTTADADASGGGKVEVVAEAAKLSPGDRALTAKAFQAAGGAVALGAAVAVGDLTNNVKATIGRGTQTAVGGAGGIAVRASDAMDVDTEALGANAGLVAAGVVIDRAGKSGSVVARLGNANAPSPSADTFVDLAGGALEVEAERSGLVRAKATAGAGGILAGSGADARATDSGLVQALVGSSVDVDNAAGSVRIEAVATPQTDASAFGINIGAGAVGASLAMARSDATVNATLGEGSDVTAAQLDVLAKREVGTGPSARAQATGASGGLLLGANATVATAESAGTTSALVGDDATLSVSGTTTVSADGASQQTASGEGFSFGFIALGADYARANSNTLTEAVLGDGVKVTGDTLQVLAASDDANYAFGLAGSGGIASAPFSEASTSNTGQAYARTGGGDATRKIDVTSLLVTASHHAAFDSWMDSTNASLIGVSGAQASNSANARAEAHIGTSGYVEADNITLQAHNDVDKAGPGTAQIPGLSRAVPAWNVNSSSGGLADVPAAGSTTVIVTNALVQVGAGARLEQTGDRNAPGAFALDAWNDVTATDKVTMASGGAVSAASGESLILADTNNATVRVGDFATLTGVGDIALGARSIADLYAQTAVDVYGAVGVAPAGDSVARFQATNAIEIGAAAIESLHDIKLAAGASSSGAGNDLEATARTDVYNNTAIPVNRDPVADAVVGTHSQITVANGADLAAVRHITLFAEKGSATASGVGIGKDIYREALAEVASAISNAFGGEDVSFETRTGNSIKNQSSAVTVNGDVRVGIHRKQALEIGFDGTATSQTDGISISGTGFRDIAADILARINDLEGLIRQYSVDNASADASIAVAAYRSEIRFLERKLDELGFPRNGQSGFSGVASVSPLQAAQQAVAGMTATKTGYTTEKTTLEGANTTLNGQITGHQATVSANNTTISNNSATIAANNTTIAGLDPDDDAAQIANLQSQNVTLTNQNSTLSSQNTTLTTVTIPGLQAQVNTNTASISNLTNLITSISTQIDSVQLGIDTNQYSNTAVGGPVARFLTISDAVAQLGNIYVRGDRLHGAGTLDAPGDAEIKITNNGPNFVILKNLTIPPDEGGKLYFNSIDVKDNTQINGVNGPAGGAAFTIFTAESQIDSGGNAVTPGKPRILVESKYDPLNPAHVAQTPNGTPTLAPDIILQGDISNLRGLVKIDSAAGSIRLEQKRDGAGNIIPPGETASIRANDVEIATRNGDFVQSYTNTFSHVAGAPLTIVPGDPNLAFPGNIDSISRTPESAGAGIVANGSVLIAARYLNINGTIQSGIPEWGVRVPSNATVTIPGLGNGTFAQALAHYNALTPAQKAALGAEYYNVAGATVAGLTGNLQGNWEKVAVSFNAKENRLELSGVQVQGGYIELFGQIFNTNAANGGKLRVMDGYGQIKVDNQTSLPLWVNLLDTGRGVKGEINITNITGLDANGAPQVSTTTYTRDPGGARTGGFYNPTSGLRYVMTVGYDTGKDEYYRYSQSGWFDISATFSGLALDNYRINSITRSNDPLSRGEFLDVWPATPQGTYFGRTQTETTSSVLTKGRSWKDCNWWTLCANATYYQEFSVSTATKTVITDSVKADHPIAIEYIGFDQGTVNVASTGNVVLNAAINNRNGNTTVSSSGSITQSGDLPIVGGNNVALAAGTGIGATSQSLLVNVNSGGKLDATSGAGDVRVTQVVGDMKVGTIGGAGVANVVLEAERNLLAWDNAAYVQGRRVDLTARNGGIGELSSTLNNPLTVRTGYTTNQAQWPNNGLSATARDNINIKNVADAGNAAVYSGNLLLVSATSLTGDVRVETAGAVIDNNPFATTDQRTQQELADLWDALRLRGTLAQEKADEAVLAFENGKSNNYQLYWLLRQRQADGGTAYDAGFQYAVSQAENDVLAASGMNAGQIAQFAANRTAQYHQLHGEVGGLTAAYTPGYRYDASPDEETQIRRGSSWSDSQLALSVGAGLLKNITDTVATIKEPNATGRSVTLIAGSDIGSLDAPMNIDLSAGLNALTIEQKAALAAAERGDATVAGSVITLVQPRPVNVAVGAGALNASADTGFVFIGSEQDLRIDLVSAATDIRIKAAGSLINAASTPGAANLVGGGMILESATGGIGSAPDVNGAVNTPLRVTPAGGAGVIARAANDIWIETTQDLAVDTMFSRGDVRLDAAGSILDFHATESAISPEINLRARNTTLNAAGGSIGASGNPLDVGVNPDGGITATAATPGQGVYLNGPAGESFNIGAVTSGDAIALSSATGMTIDGLVEGPGAIQLSAGGELRMTPNAHVHATTLGLLVEAGSLFMEDDGTNAARMTIDAGTILINTAGNAVITGISTGNPTASAIGIHAGGSILDGGDVYLDVIADTPVAAQLTMTAGGTIGGNPLDVRLLNLESTSAGLTHLNEQDSVNVVAMQAGGEVLFNAGVAAPGSITGGPVSSTGGPVVVTASDSISLASLTASDISLTAPNSLVVTAIQAGDSVTLAADQIDATVTHTGTSGPLAFNVGNGAGGPSSLVNLSVSSPTGVVFGEFSAIEGALTVPSGDLTMSSVFVGERLTVSNPQTVLLIDQGNRSPQPADIQMYAPASPFTLNLSGLVMSTDATVIHHNQLTHTVLSTTPGGTPDLRQNVEQGLSLADQAAREVIDALAYDADARISYPEVPVALPDCSQEPAPDACR